MIKKILFQLTFFLSICAATQVVSAAGGGSGVAPARPVTIPATLVGTLASWTLNDGSTQLGNTFPASSEGYALAVNSYEGLALFKRQLKTPPLPSASSFKVNGQVAPSMLKVIWSAGKVDGAMRSGYKLVLGGASYVWNGSTHVQQLTGAEALAFVTAP